MSSGPLAKARPKLVGQIAAALFIGTGTITLATAPLPGGMGFNRTGTILIGAFAVAAGVATALLPWDRLPSSATLLLIPVGLALICLGNLFGGTMPYTYGTPFVLVFVWIGIAHARKVSILVAPLAAVAYILPFLWLPGDVLVNVSTTAFSIPVCVLVGETLAFVLERMERTEEALARTVARLEVLHDVDRSVIGASTALELVTSTLSRLRQNVVCERATVIAFDLEKRQAQWVGVSQDRELGLPVGSVLPLDALPPEVLRQEPTWYVEDAQDLTSDSQVIIQLVSRGIRSFVAAPMIMQGEWIGELFVASVEPNRFTDDDQMIVREVGNQLAVALRHTQLREELVRHAFQLEALVEEVNRSAGLRRRLLARLVVAQEAERQRIAENIHDDSIQKMTAVGIRLETMRQLLEDGDPERSLEIVDGLEAATEGAIRRLRYLMFELRPASLDREGLAAAVREYLTEAAEEGGFSWEVDDGLSRTPPADIRAVIYRIAQEALANVRKHARASHVSVTLRESDEGISTRVADDGVGFDLERSEAGAGHHLGLASMRERAEMAGGTLFVQSEPAGGTAVEFWLPTPEMAAPVYDVAVGED